MKKRLCLVLGSLALGSLFSQNANLSTLLAEQSPAASRTSAALSGLVSGTGSAALGMSGLADQGVVYNPQLALSASFYPVTAGDVYQLAYAAGSVPVTYKILVDSTYKVRVANLAVIDASGKSFAELKAQVETIIGKNYPLSGVQFGLEAPSIFRVTLKGEVSATAERQAWPLTRLSEALKGSLTPYSSVRDVRVTASSGKTAVYDLYKAIRDGDLSQDPLLRPDDVISLSRYERSVTITGAVERPGTYQLLKGENLRDLIETYGGGYTQVADPSRIELVRYVGSPNHSGIKYFLTGSEADSGFSLNDYDSVSVGTVTDLIPVMFMEGALARVHQDSSTNALVALQDTGGSELTATPEASSRLSVRFNAGENYASLARRCKAAFSSVSDTANAYIVRGNERIAINLNPMLYDASYRSEYEVEPNDVLIIPFRQYFVTVAGSVRTPGRYPFIPDRDWSYYVALAGGFDTLKNSYEMVRITDVSGNKMKKSDPIAPETVIEASTNSFLFYFNQYAPVVTTTLTALSTSLTVYMLLQQ